MHFANLHGAPNAVRLGDRHNGGHGMRSWVFVLAGTIAIGVTVALSADAFFASEDAAATPSIVVVRDWFEALKRLVPTE